MKNQAAVKEKQGATNNEGYVTPPVPAASKNEPVVAKVGIETPENERSAATANRAVTKKEQQVIIEARAETKKEQIATKGQIATDGVKAVTKTDDIEGSSEAPVVDWAIYKKTETAMKNRFETLLDGFLDNTTRYVGDIGRALEQGDAKLIALRAHTIKSSARIMGALQLAQAAEELEALSKSATTNLADLPEIKDNVTDLRKLFDTTRLTLRTGTTAGAS
jgi:HPt (histidine-containing phosphotransfer) domain-containing protein